MAGDQDVEHRVGTQHEGADIAQHAEQGHAEQLRLHSRGAQDRRPQEQPRRQQRQRYATHRGVGGGKDARGHLDVDSWVGSFAKASAEAALVVARSISCVAKNFGSACWAMTCFDTISMTLISGATWAMTPSMVTNPRASMVTDEVIIMFWPRSTSMTSVSTVPTLISFISAVLYSASNLESASSSAP